MTTANRRPLISAGTLVGVGMGGFIDGILFHQILQIHNMLSAKYPPTTLVNLEINMVWDGLFHSFTWITTALGIAGLWKAGQRSEVPWSTNTFIGSLVFGWGLFNLVEGLINHHLLGIHHVVEQFGLSLWDYAFLLSGAFLIALGCFVMQKGKSDTPRHL